MGLTEVQGHILAIDPGSRKLGWAIVADGPRRVDSGVLRLAERLPLNERLGQILTALQELFEKYAPAQLAIESAFVHDNAHTALVLGQTRGLPIALAAARGLPIFEYTPAVVKKRIAGSGRAEKGQMREMIRLQLKLAELPGEDEADALAVGLTHYFQTRWTTIAVATPHAAAVPLPPALTPAQQTYLAAMQVAKRQKSFKRAK